MMFKKISIIFFFLALTCPGYGKDITILYSGDTHAMIYPCNCPIEPDGGILRRSTLVKEIRRTTPDALLVDSGSFFAGGLRDGYTQNTELDMRRSLINLKAMELMGYDAVNIGDDEFNFGRGFFEDNIAKTELHFISANVKSGRISPYVIKEINGIKIGIIGLTDLSAKQKADGLKISEPKLALQEAVGELHAKGVKLILLLSHLGESLDLELIQDIEGIDIVVSGNIHLKEEPSSKIGNTIILRPSWQGRRLGRLSLSIADGKISGYKVDEVRLSDAISDDPDIKSILPKCFSDSNCKKEGLLGTCRDPGSMQASCSFNQPQKVNLLVIAPKDCRVCDTERVILALRSYFPGLAPSYLYYPDRRSEKIIKDLGLTFLPAYLLGRGIEKEKSFDNLRGNLILKDKFYVVKAQLSGMSYLLGRKKVKGKLDLALSLYDKNAPELLRTIQEFKPDIHLLATEKGNNFDAFRGNAEIEEYLRAVCVQKYYPRYFFDYITCRSQNINSSWWEDCLSKADAARIRSCARSQEGAGLLRENISLNKELGIMFGPTYIVDNQEIFSTQGVPDKEEFKKILGR